MHFMIQLRQMYPATSVTNAVSNTAMNGLTACALSTMLIKAAVQYFLHLPTMTNISPTTLMKHTCWTTTLPFRQLVFEFVPFEQLFQVFPFLFVQSLHLFDFHIALFVVLPFQTVQLHLFSFCVCSRVSQLFLLLFSFCSFHSFYHV